MTFNEWLEKSGLNPQPKYSRYYTRPELHSAWLAALEHAAEIADRHGRGLPTVSLNTESANYYSGAESAAESIAAAIRSAAQADKGEG